MTQPRQAKEDNVTAVQAASHWRGRPALTVEEAADVLRIGRSAAYAAVKAGEIPSIKVGRSIRVPTFRLEQLLGLQTDDEPAGNGLEVTTSAEVATDDEHKV
jgi:excisionase family DNA binding protein